MGSWSHPLPEVLSPRASPTQASGNHSSIISPYAPVLCTKAHRAPAGPVCAVLFCDSGLLFTFVSSLPFSFPLCPNTSIFLTPARLSSPTWCRLLPPHFSSRQPSPPSREALQFGCYTPCFQLQGELPRAASLVLCLRHLVGNRCLTNMSN